MAQKRFISATLFASLVDMLQVGEALRTAREAKGKSLADAAEDTRVRQDYLAALEDENFDIIGGDAWVRGFLRTYGRYLGLDTDRLVRSFNGQHLGAHSPKAIPGVQDKISFFERIRLMMPLIIGLGIVVIIGLAFMTQRRPTVQKPEDVLGPAPATVSPSDMPTDIADPIPDIKGTPMDAPNLEITAQKPVQIQVISGNPFGQQSLETEQSIRISDENTVQVYINSAQNVSVDVNGLALGSLSPNSGGVILTCSKGFVACTAEDR